LKNTRNSRTFKIAKPPCNWCYSRRLHNWSLVLYVRRQRRKIS
jgi:hypothetical protein